MTDIDSITDEWWNLHNHDFLGVNYSNKDTYTVTYVPGYGEEIDKYYPTGLTAEERIDWVLNYEK